MGNNKVTQDTINNLSYGGNTNIKTTINNSSKTINQLITEKTLQQYFSNNISIPNNDNNNITEWWNTDNTTTLVNNNTINTAFTPITSSAAAIPIPPNSSQFSDNENKSSSFSLAHKTKPLSFKPSANSSSISNIPSRNSTTTSSLNSVTSLAVQHSRQSTKEEDNNFFLYNNPSKSIVKKSMNNSTMQDAINENDALSEINSNSKSNISRLPDSDTVPHDSEPSFSNRSSEVSVPSSNRNISNTYTQYADRIEGRIFMRSKY